MSSSVSRRMEEAWSVALAPGQNEAVRETEGCEGMGGGLNLRTSHSFKHRFLRLCHKLVLNGQISKLSQSSIFKSVRLYLEGNDGVSSTTFLGV